LQSASQSENHRTRYLLRNKSGEYCRQAEVDLRNIYVYIATEQLQAPENADGQLERIKDAIYKLANSRKGFGFMMRTQEK